MKNTSKLIGTTCIVAGTNIGAGMLALPMVSHSMGFIPSLIAIGTMCALMYFTALVTLEVSLKMGAPQGMSIALMGRKLFGQAADWLLRAVLGALFFALLTAYTVGGASILRSFAPTLFISDTISITVFAIAMALPIVAHVKWLDITNRIAFTVMLCVFAVMVVGVASSIEPARLGEIRSLKNPFLLAIPIFFTAFGFHGSIPSLMNYCRGDIHTLKKAFLIGSLIPMVIYAAWIGTSIGIIPETGDHSFATIPDGSVGALIDVLVHHSHAQWVTVMGVAFAFLAIATSFFGVGIGLLDLIKEAFAHRKNPRLLISNQSTHWASVVITFGIPLAIALYDPNIFLWVLSFAATCLSILAVLAPVSFAWKLRNQPGEFNAPGGKWALLIAFVIGLVIALRR